MPRAENPDSCTLLLTDGKHHILLTGDADLSVEYKILPKLDKIHVLQVGHHGSKTSTGEALVRHTQPDIALIPVAAGILGIFPIKRSLIA